MTNQRLFQILYILLDKKKLTIRELAEHFEVSTRTIQRDIERLSSAGIPLYTTRGQGGGVFLMENFILNKALLSAEEQSQILIALENLAVTDPEKTDLLPKLRALFQSPETDWIEVDLSRWGSKTTDKPTFQTLKHAVLDKAVVTFSYTSAYGSKMQRTVYPAKLIFKTSTWYLQAFCTTRNAFRTFKLDRMSNLHALPEHFTLHESPPPLDEPTAGGPFLSLTLCLPPELTARAYEEFEETEITQTPSGSLIINATMPEDFWLYGYLLSFGPLLEVLSPLRVRQTLATLAKEIFEKNSAPISNTTEDVHFDPLYPSHAPCTITSTTENTMEAYCQSCGMPMAGQEALYGTEANGSKSTEYCSYCYDKGQFLANCTMEEMIEVCIAPMVEHNPNMSADQARAMMLAFMPTLKRWKK